MEAVWTIEMAAHGVRAAPPGEAELIAAARGGDADAFSELVRLHQRRVFLLAGRFYRHREDVEDAAQDTFLTVWRKLGTYRATAPFEHWLTRVCLNCCYARLQRKTPIGVDLSAVAEPAQPGGDPGAAVELDRLLARLKPKDRFILLLLDGEGRTVAEVAERLGWSVSNVKVRAHRARKRLRAVLEQTS